MPITDAAGHPVGVLAVDDLARMAAHARKSSVDRELVQTLAAVCRPAAHASPARKAASLVV